MTNPGDALESTLQKNVRPRSIIEPGASRRAGLPSMFETIQQLSHAIVLCNDMDRMKAFYKDLFSFPIEVETDTSLSFRAGSVVLGLRQRTRKYDGRGGVPESPGLQLAFQVSPAEVNQCYDELVAKGVTILDPPNDQLRGHRTVYFADPEGNLLEIYAEI